MDREDSVHGLCEDDGVLPKRGRAESPDLFLYFAKNEECKHLNAGEVGLTKVEDRTFESVAATIYRTGSGLPVGVVAGSRQGSGFYFDFVNFVHRVRPLAVIMCGICAGLGEAKEGDVMIGTHSVLMQGKIERIDLSNLDLEPCDPASATSNYDGLWTKLDVTPKVHVGTYLQSPFVLGFDLHVLQQRLQPAFRKLIAIDMESWFCLNSQTRLKQSIILPVVKGISDKGAGKSDEHHHAAINNSVSVALCILENLAKQQATEPLQTQGHALTNAVLQPKRRKSSSSITFTRDEARELLRSGGLEEALLEKALETLDTSLRTSSWLNMGTKRYENVRNFFSVDAQRIFDRQFKK